MAHFLTNSLDLSSANYGGGVIEDYREAMAKFRFLWQRSRIRRFRSLLVLKRGAF